MIVHTDTCFTLHTAHTSYQMAVGPGGQTPACIWYLRRAATCQDDKKG